MRFPKSLLGWFPRRQAKRRLAAQRRQSLPLAAERFEERTLLTDLVLDGATTLLVTATGPASGTYSLDGSTPVTFTDIDSFTFNGDASDNQLTEKPAPPPPSSCKRSPLVAEVWPAPL